MAGAAGVTGLDAVDVQVAAPQQAVAVNLADLVKGELFSLCSAYSSGTSRISARLSSAMSRAVLYCPSASRPCTVRKWVFCRPGFGVVVHQADERITAARHVVRQRDAGVVTDWITMPLFSSSTGT